ncbi:hypothetical protein BV898_11800 [Hypsibius exemplaris]|uniref:Uncharacterized protein n=1 Tax=Hypsibius exemplaris TaxID=2072580 RepID=A0A1W0WFR4_HYPEX|nr:hypothetical protein BV898_11800 [Hypsibius exemplaris]
MPTLQQLAVLSVVALTVSIGSCWVGQVRGETVAAAAKVPRISSRQATSPALQWFFRKMGKRGSGAVHEKCGEQAACAMLQLQPGAAGAGGAFWTEEICSCGEGTAACSLEWDEQNADGRSVTNADTQLKLCRPVNSFPVCLPQQIAVTSTMETSVAHPQITQTASMFCSCPLQANEFKLADAKMDDEGDRTKVSALFSCVPVEHCRSQQPCKFLAVLPTGDTLVHQNCECPDRQQCPRDSSPNGIVPSVTDEITYYPFFCQ